MAVADSTLLLVPTAGERDRLIAAMQRRHKCLPRTELCGFGLIAAAASTMRLIATDRPDKVILAGIAGGLNSVAKIGTAHWFGGVICDGIGVGQSDSFVPAAEMGWDQWSGVDECIGDRLRMQWPDDVPAMSRGNSLVSVCAASSDRAMAESRRDRFEKYAVDSVLAEDMEAFGVAMSCRMMNVPCHVIRGISNLAGDRDHANWEIDEAMRSVAARLRSMPS